MSCSHHSSERDADTCVACGWALENNSWVNYNSNIKLFDTAYDKGAWSIGSKFILKDRMVFPPSYEGINLRFLKGKVNIPIPDIMQEWIDGSRYFSITSRIEGTTLEQAWPTLSWVDKTRIAKQVADNLEEMRGLTSPRIEAVGGMPMYEASLFPKGDAGQQPLSSDQELRMELEEPLLHLDENMRRTLFANMPRCRPYTFTHGDLTICNIMVKDGNFSGFIDFERSGFFPVWYEYVCCRFAFGQVDMEWKTLLSEHITKYPKAMNFQMALSKLRRYPYRSEEALNCLNHLVEEKNPESP
ncbi:hypothetical protein M434DRAFT_22391 [Hypoxylon sp. CO27-5]|nr:hypothetical protein M434DRAFT_22391 [Hypoxylon sp. CO27-5]